MANKIVIGSHSSVVKLLVKLGRLFSNLDLVTIPHIQHKHEHCRLQRTDGKPNTFLV